MEKETKYQSIPSHKKNKPCKEMADIGFVKN
jgi:hypothetical protein